MNTDVVLYGVAVVVLPMIISPDDRTRHTNTQSTNGENPYTKRDTDEKENIGTSEGHYW